MDDKILVPMSAEEFDEWRKQRDCPPNNSTLRAIPDFTLYGEKLYVSNQNPELPKMVAVALRQGTNAIFALNRTSAAIRTGRQQLIDANAQAKELKDHAEQSATALKNCLENQ